MSADVTNATDAITYNQFSGQMVIALFIQILIMILDRYLYKSKTFISIAEKGLKKSAKDKKKELKKSQVQQQQVSTQGVGLGLGLGGGGGGVTG